MTTNTTTWIRRISAGVVLAAAPALIALGAAPMSTAQTGSSSNATTPSYTPMPTGPLNGQYPWHNQPWYNSSFHHRHAAEQQSQY
ncbi:MAG: hypothetical protein JO191_03700 [Mycobacteriaceae bacterium]|nr:hypothetical protein [Mycobacteriaceae bacterium]